MLFSRIIDSFLCDWLFRVQQTHTQFFHVMSVSYDTEIPLHAYSIPIFELCAR